MKRSTQHPNAPQDKLVLVSIECEGNKYLFRIKNSCVVMNINHASKDPET